MNDRVAIYIVNLIWIINFQNLRLEPLKAYIRNQLLTPAAISLPFFCCLSFVWLNLSSLVGPIQIPWKQICRSGAYVKAAILIIIAYATLLVVNTRYISLFIMPTIMLVFIGALFVIVPPKFDEDNNDDVNRADKVADEDNVMFLTAVLPSWVLFCMGNFRANNLVLSQFLLFFSSSLGELTLMMARLSSKEAPAFEVMHRASLVMVVLTGHTMAAELLGDIAVLVCTPELVAALVWLIIHMGFDGNATVRTIEAALRRVHVAVLGVVATLIYMYLAGIMDETEVETDLLSSYTLALFACAFSVVLPSLCVFALCQWQGQTTDTPLSDDLEGAIRLLNFFRDISLQAVAMFLVAKPLVDVRLRLQLQGLLADRWNVVYKKFGAGTE